MTTEVKPREILPEVERRYVAWAGNNSDEAFSYLISRLNWESKEKIAPTLFELHLMYEEASELKTKFSAVREWAYGVAVDYAMSMKIRYGLDWGRQAALDGAFLAMWPDEKSGAGMLTIPLRAIQFGVCEDNYAAVRRHVKNRAVVLLNDYGQRLEDAIKSGF